MQTTIISIISDTHGILDQSVKQHLNSSDIIIHAGDVMSTDLIKHLKNNYKKTFIVAGNNDIPERYNNLDDKKIISTLNKVENIDVCGEKITVTHGDQFGGMPSHIELRENYPESKLIIYGHTHYQIFDDSESPWVMNPGASGHTRNMNGGPCFSQIHINNKSWNVKQFCFN
tara:strand:+ start:1276 stop:1791 length:516 start_codon:yes stop_codon:yes gene_type:complete